MADNDNFELDQSFEIDNGQLDGLTPQQCFVLGYEFAHVNELLKTGLRMSKPIHAANRQRVKDLCRKACRGFSIRWLVDDVSERWLGLHVEPAGEETDA